MEIKRKSVADFFAENNIELFDFTNEILEHITVESDENKKLKKEYLSDNIDPLKKYLIYKVIFPKSDPDINKGLLKDIYKEVWNDCLNLCESNSCDYYSDTMTSAQGLLNDFYLLCSGEKKCSKSIMYEMYQHPSKYPKFKECFMSEEGSGMIIKNFLKHYHTLGNYIPVPEGFNKPRSGGYTNSGVYANYDMWDLTLRKIKEYYDFPNKRVDFKVLGSALLDLFHYKNTLINTQEWLKYFGSWEEFVNQNFLKEETINGVEYKNYVDKNYEIVDFFSKIHDFDNPKFKSKDDYLKYFEKITEVIEDRTKIIKYAYEQKKGGKEYE